MGSPAIGGRTHDPLAILEAGIAVGRIARVEVDVVGDRDLGETQRDGLRRVQVDRDGAVGRLVGVDVGVERQAPGLLVDDARIVSREPEFTPR